MAIKRQLRRDTAAQWTANNPTLAEGEFGVETESIGTLALRMKIGNGFSNWNNLAYVSINPLIVESFSATDSQTEYTVGKNKITNDGSYQIIVDGVQWNSRTGAVAFPNGNVTINFGTGVITFNIPLEENAQVVIRYN